MGQMMEFAFEEHRIADAACYLLSRYDGPMSYLKLSKLLYLADRKSLLAQGATVTRDRLVALADGPAVEQVLKLARGHELPANSCWPQHVTPSEHGCVGAVGHGELGWLPEFSRRMINEVMAEYGSLTDAELIELTRGLPEWEAPQAGSCLIDPAAIMRLEGVPEEDIAEAASLAAAHLELMLTVRE